MSDKQRFTFTDFFSKEIVIRQAPENIQEPVIIKPIYLGLEERKIYLQRHNITDQLDTDALSQNTSAVHIFDQFPELIVWDELSSNPNAIDLLLRNMEKINWEQFSLNTNKHAVDILEKNLDKVEWYNLALNPKAIHIIEKYLEVLKHENFDFIWRPLSSNPEAICILEKNIDKIHWTELFSNTNAVHLINMIVQLNEDYSYERPLSNFSHVMWANPVAIYFLEQIFDYVNWRFFSKNPNGIHLIEKNLDKVHWDMLSTNPKAIHILQENLDKVHWYELFRNPEAFPIISMFFPLDYQKMHENTKEFRQELLSVVMCPDRLSRMSIAFHLTFEEYIIFYQV